MRRLTAQKRKRVKLRVLLLGIVLGTVILLLACSPQQGASNGSDEGSGQENGTATPIEWTVETDCGSCHTNEQVTAEEYPCEAAEETGSKCVICHVSDEAEMQKIHEGVTTEDTVPKRLKETEVSDETCLECHYGTREALIAATDGVAVVTDTNGLSLNPHNPGSAGTTHTTITCASCHDPHDTVEVQEKAQAECESCHHQGVFECYTCHD